MSFKLKIIIGLIAVLCNQPCIFGQNLIPNPSFEEVFETPLQRSPTGEFLYVKEWFTPTLGSPDIFSINAINPQISIPSNVFGYQESIFGNNYCGIYLCYLLSLPNENEYISVKLTEPLKTNKRYCFNVQISCASFCCSWTVNNFGFLLSQDHPYNLDKYPNQYFISSQTTWQNLDYLNNDTKWEQISAEFIAEGEEQYITIGIFTDPLISDTLQTGNIPTGSPCFYFNTYYYIDMVSLECCDPNGCDEISIGEKINTQKLTVYPNPLAKQVTLKFTEPFNKALTYSITDLQGRQLLQGSIQNQETMLDISNLSKGIYLLNISDAEGNKWNKKIVKGE